MHVWLCDPDNGHQTKESKPGLIDVGLKEYSREEADAQIPLHVLVRRSSTIKVDVWSPDTDVLILLMDLVALAEQRLHAENL